MSLQGHVDIISSLEVAGWAIDWDQPQAVLDIAVIVDGMQVGSCRTHIERPGLRKVLGNGASGVHEFKYAFNPPLDAGHPHHIEVMAAHSHELLPNGRRTLHRASTPHSRLTPILLTSNGRSGSTMVMRAFATHPDIAVANLYPFEFKLTSYYAAAWHVLTQPAHAPSTDEVDFAARASRDLVIGRNPWNRPDLMASLGGTHATRLFGQTVPDQMAQLFKSIVNETYGIVATETGKSPRFLAEKFAIEESVRHACREVFTEVKEVVLIRDPRDHLCSARKFWKHDIGELMNTQAVELPILSRIYHQHRSDVLFVRYEDLILNTTEAYRRIYQFIGCATEFQPHAINADKVPDAHRTSASAAESIGRFRNELEPLTLETVNTRFGGFLDLFDYQR